MPQNEMLRILGNADIFLYPSQLDTFGFSIVEAMGLGIPTVALSTKNNSSIKEIINNGKTGFLIDYDNIQRPVSSIGEKEEIVIKSFIEKINLLFEDKKLYSEISQNCLIEVKTGKFSIRERNKKLERIYKEAIRWGYFI